MVIVFLKAIVAVVTHVRAFLIVQNLLSHQSDIRADINRRHGQYQKHQTQRGYINRGDGKPAKIRRKDTEQDKP